MRANEIKINILHTGIVEIDKSLMFRDESRTPFGFTRIGRSIKQRVLVPVSSYLIQHPAGTILIDTGWGKQVRQLKHQWISPVAKSYLPQGWSIDEQLEKFKLKPENLDVVILSHLDSDHIGGLQLVKKAKKFLVHENELAAVVKNPIRYRKKEWQGIKLDAIVTSQFNNYFNRASFDVFGDGSVLIFLTSGHSRGLSSVVVRNQAGKFVVFASDTGYAKDSWESMRLPGILYRKKEAVESLAWIRQISNYPECQGVFANHDPDILEQTILL
ncbi:MULTISPECIES: N-acyl homoserine lactonase family protein [unclassified Enterococcus]|uniref:N-acyl homoserine lactonase family protein n=1 Tax=unclassified Enterococcus TaxID=2608891 RepID=UPI001551D4F9|nr:MULTISPECIES: N-acyl homoserine lactonase family protein [unclassified Enterococcus]MBS7578370.1 N-acyl homoserine lactonase family protein [Enterococcus sp. MMGLQ5-2]MBS7585554.1 N-acyl homoserine lactonase family protein [Enterococcus sp. MMGLQ5-1]NPD13413.1 N-acyl homoserine lactonase family protein [Enterococcus sp. MMGLQ5-1]NPD38202.1 N-acyl homoserine lactonase family protein [Enterococcus sp. MMGLQ5-2]